MFKGKEFIMSEQDSKWKFLIIADDTPEFSKVLRLASKRAEKVGGSILLLHIIPPADFQHWTSVKDIMEEESMKEAREQVNKHVQEIMKISGLDAETFLQGQLSNDIKQLNTSSVQLNAYCQHQGKILALFWVMKYEDSFLLSFPLDLLETIKPRLQMFVIMSDVTIDDVTSSYLQIGTLDEEYQNAYVINDKLSLIIDDKKNSTNKE